MFLCLDSVLPASPRLDRLTLAVHDIFRQLAMIG